MPGAGAYGHHMDGADGTPPAKRARTEAEPPGRGHAPAQQCAHP